jgi:hypothetical protein
MIQKICIKEIVNIHVGVFTGLILGYVSVSRRTFIIKMATVIPMLLPEDDPDNSSKPVMRHWIV